MQRIQLKDPVFVPFYFYNVHLMAGFFKNKFCDMTVKILGTATAIWAGWEVYKFYMLNRPSVCLAVETTTV